MFKIKICGITTPEDALLAVDAGADAIGMNFYEKSPRYVSPAHAGEIATALQRRKWSGGLTGVYVNLNNAEQFVEQFTETGPTVGIDLVQLHGDEPPALIAELHDYFDKIAQLPGLELSWITGPIPPIRLQIIRAARCQGSTLTEIEHYLEQCRSAGGLPHAILLDAHASDSYGGTGQTLDWNMIRDERDRLLGLPLILAGGLTPDNVAEAIATARPDAVDVASGVESSPGKKDPAKVRDFVAAAKEAFARLGATKTKES